LLAFRENGGESETNVGFAFIFASYASYQAAMAGRIARGLVVDGRNGPQRNPAVNAELEAVAKLQQMLDRFGLNPPARTRVLSLTEDAADEFEDFVAAKTG